MVVRFDSLDRFEKPKLYLCNPGCTYTNGRLSSVAGILTDTSDEEIIFQFNDVSELNFRATRIRREDSTENEYIYNLYKGIQNRRLIYVDDIGFFIIRSVTDGYDGTIHYKDVHAESIEGEIQNKLVPYIADGTYNFTTLLNTVIAVTPAWTVDHVDSSLALLYRTFEDVSTDENALAFMLEEMQDAYECIFVFDITNRQVSAYAQDDYVVDTDIHITKDDLITSLDMEETSDDLYTALSVTGDNDLLISAVNPLGTSVVYNFDYYLDWMSASLKSRVQSWETLVSQRETTYYNLNLEYYEKLTDQTDLEADIEKYDIQLTMYKRCRDNIVANVNTEAVAGYNVILVENGGTPITVCAELADTIAGIDTLIVYVNGQKSAAQDDLDELEAEIDDLHDDIEAIHDEVDITSYFTISGDTSLLEELHTYMYEGTYTDEYVTVTDSMTYEQKFAQMKILYDMGKNQLEIASQPTQKFTVDVENFIFAKDFADWSDQLETGCLINVEIEEGETAMLFLSDMTVNYEDASLSMTFGNRFNKFNPKSLFDDVLGNISKTANTLSYVKDTVYPIKSGEFDEMKEAIATSRNLAKDAVISSANEEVVIDDTGYTGRRIDPTTHEYDPKQIKISGRNIVFTDDAWETSKTAIGEITVPGSTTGETKYGINAELVVGNVIVGEELHIVDDDGEDMFEVTKEEIRVEFDDDFAAKDVAVSTVEVYYALSGSTTIAPTTGWSTTAPEWTSGMYMWQKTKTVYADSTATVPHVSWSDPTCIAGAKGEDGTSGAKTAIIQLYKRSATAPSIDWTDTITYTFATAVISPTPTGWSQIVPSGDDPLYVTAATAYGTGTTDTIAYTEWSTPSCLSKNGAAGNDGVDGSTIWTTSVAPTTPDYTFNISDLSGPAGQTPKVSDLIVYSYYRYSISMVGTDAVLASGRTSIRGADGVNSATVFLYTRSATTPTAPTSDLTYTFATGALSGTLGQWSQNVPATDGTPCYSIQATAASGEATYIIQSSSWSSPLLIMEDGTDGTDGQNGTDGAEIVSITAQYYLSTSSTTTTGGSWSITQPEWESGKYIWSRSFVQMSNSTEFYTDAVLSNNLNAMGEDISTCKSRITANENGIQQNYNYYQTVNSKVNNIEAYIQTGNIGTAESPEYGVKIGKTDGTGNFTSKFTSDELGFYDGEDKTAYFSNKKLNVSTMRTAVLELTDDLDDSTVSNWQIVADSDNGFCIKWVGSST